MKEPFPFAETNNAVSSCLSVLAVKRDIVRVPAEGEDDLPPSLI